MISAIPSADNIALPLRHRPDVRAVEHRVGGVRNWTLKDPASLNYFQLSAEERFIYDQLDGETSLGEIRDRFEVAFAPLRITLPTLHAYVGRLHQEGLLLGDVPGQAEVLLERRDERIKQERRQRWSSVLAVRFRGVDPQRFLDWLYPACRWMFSTVTLALCALLVFSAAGLVLLHWREVSARLPEFEQFLGGRNLIWLGVTLMGIKVLHELAHGLTLRHFGGDCHEIGPMLLLCVPCLYANTTDSWMLPSKWQRAAVAGAGIALELVLAALATFLWWWSEPGLFNSLALDVMIVCSISTLFFNGNPLLKYDGYFVASDLLEIPNLSQRAAEVVHRGFAKWFLALSLPSSRPMGTREQPFWLVVYWCASLAYRLFVVAAVLWGIHRLLGPRGLDLLTVLVATSVMLGMVAPPSLAAGRFVRDPRWRDRVNLRRFRFRGLLVLAAVVGFALIPLPASIRVPVVTRVADAERVYVTVPGRIEKSLAAGATVAKGDLIAQLRNPEIELKVTKLRDERDRQALHIENLRRQMASSPEAADSLPAAEAALADLESRLQERLAEEQRLQIVAPRSGSLITPPALVEQAEPHQLQEWKGNPLDPINRGAFLKTGTLLASVGDPSNLEAIAVIDQREIGLVAPGQPVTFWFGGYSQPTRSAKVVEISPARIDELPAELAHSEEIPQAGGENAAEALRTVYQARIKMEAGTVPIASGVVGTARVTVAPQSIATRLLRFLAATFRLDW